MPNNRAAPAPVPILWRSAKRSDGFFRSVGPFLLCSHSSERPDLIPPQPLPPARLRQSLRRRSRPPNAFPASLRSLSHWNILSARHGKRLAQGCNRESKPPCCGACRLPHRLYLAPYRQCTRIGGVCKEEARTKSFSFLGLSCRCMRDVV